MENFIYGKNSVLELISSNMRSINRIILQKGLHSSPKIEKIIALAKNRGIAFQFLPKEQFQKYSEVPHQGVIAYVPPVEYTDFNDFLKKDKQYKRVIITDRIEDSYNMGSIIRTAVCAGFDAVIFPKRRNAMINAAAEKSSAGAVNHIDLIMADSLAAIIDKLKNAGFWVIAADINADDNYFEIDYCRMNFAIVLGSEKSGISSSLLKQADYRVKIPMLRNFDSLNVSNAASILMYEAVRQIMQKSPNIV